MGIPVRENHTKQTPFLLAPLEGVRYDAIVQETAAKFRNFAEAEKADREFYKNLTPQERLDLLLELLNHAPEQRLERVYRVTKLSRD